MEQLHKDLQKKFGWYKKWHKMPYVSSLHLALFVVAVVLLANWALLIVEAQDAQAFVAPILSTSPTLVHPALQTPKEILTVGSAVTTTSKLAVRDAPQKSGALLCQEALGAHGTVMSGPKSADEYVWWQVRFADGCSGWVVQNYLWP